MHKYENCHRNAEDCRRIKYYAANEPNKPHLGTQCVCTTHVNNHRRNHCHPQQWEMFKVSSFEEYEMLNRFDNLLLLCLYTMRK